MTTAQPRNDNSATKAVIPGSTRDPLIAGAATPAPIRGWNDGHKGLRITSCRLPRKAIKKPPEAPSRSNKELLMHRVVAADPGRW